MPCKNEKSRFVTGFTQNKYKILLVSQTCYTNCTSQALHLRLINYSTSACNCAFLLCVRSSDITAAPVADGKAITFERHAARARTQRSEYSSSAGATLHHEGQILARIINHDDDLVSLQCLANVTIGFGRFAANNSGQHSTAANNIRKFCTPFPPPPSLPSFLSLLSGFLPTTVGDKR